MYIIIETLIRITNLLLLLIVTLLILPASAIMYASGSTDNSDGSSDSGSTDNSDGSSDSGSTDNSDGSSDSGSTENNAALPTTSPENNAALASATRVNNNTGNAYCDTCNDDIYNGGGDLESMVLAVHNRERAAVSVPPLIWSDEIASTAQIYADYLHATGKFEHRTAEYIATHPNDSAVWGENLAARYGAPISVPIAQNIQGWIAEKNSFQGLPSATGDETIGHYTQMVWKSTTEVGCGTATGNDYDVLVCRYNPPGNSGGNPY